MKNEVNFKKITVTAFISTIMILLLSFFYNPGDYLFAQKIKTFFDEKMISHQISNQRLYIRVWRLTKSLYIDSSLNNQNWNRWRNKYLKHIKTMEDANLAINSMLLSLNDKYTKFLPPDIFTLEKAVFNAEVAEIGLSIDLSSENIVVSNVRKNSSAFNVDIFKGDIISFVNGIQVNSSLAHIFLDTVKNSKIDTVELIIKRNDTFIKKVLKKKIVKLQTMEYEITKDNIGIISIYSIMGENAVNDFKNIILKTNNTKGIIIDLRDNFGGILFNAIEMLNYMIDVNEIISIKSRSNEKYTVFSDGKILFKKKPIIILINNSTASAAEIIAGVLKFYNKAKLVGENSYGKNSIQNIISLPNFSGLIITTNTYNLPLDSDFGNTGLTPDFYVKNKTYSAIDFQKNAALEILRNK